MTPPAAPRHLAQNLEDALDADDQPEISRHAVPAELLEPPTSGRLVRMAAEEWALMLALWAALAVSPWWIDLVWMALLAGRFHALGVVLHDAVHMPLPRKTARVRLVEILCGYPIATTLEAMRYHHLRHHRDSGMVTDPYYKAGVQDRWWWTLNVLRGLLLVPFWSARAYVGVIALAVPALRNVYAHVFLQDRTPLDLRGSAEVEDCARADRGQVAFQAAVIGAALFFPHAVLYGYVVPVSLAGVLAARRLLIEHRYTPVSDRRPETILRTTNDNHLGWLGAVVLAPRHIGYHVVHHVHPRVGLHALPRLRAWYVDRYPTQYPPPR
jgi:fatty acid desaturase